MIRSRLWGIGRKGKCLFTVSVNAQPNIVLGWLGCLSPAPRPGCSLCSMSLLLIDDSASRICRYISLMVYGEILLQVQKDKLKFRTEQEIRMMDLGAVGGVSW